MISTIVFAGLILLVVVLFAFLVLKIIDLSSEWGVVLMVLIILLVLISLLGVTVGINRVIYQPRPYDYQLSGGVEYTTVAEYRDGKSFVIIVSSGKKNKNMMHSLRVIRVKKAPPEYFMLNGDGVPVSLLLPKKK